MLIGWKTVLSYLGDFLVSPQSPQRADIIVVLGGDFWGPRVVKGADLAVQGYAPVVLFSGTMYGRRPEGEAAISFLAGKGYRVDSFEYFLHHAPSTIDEAIVLRGELARRGVKRVLLVTSAYHSRRASIVFRLFCPGLQFITIGAPDDHYHPDDWWEDASSRKLFVSEWGKIFGTILLEYPKHLAERMVPGDGG
ncbi:MAG: YdcF family protein [Bryobacteraceae bacterium]